MTKQFRQSRFATKLADEDFSELGVNRRSGLCARLRRMGWLTLLFSTTCRFLLAVEYDLQVRGSFLTNPPALDVAVEGHYAYLVVVNALLVIDVSVPSNPRQVGRYGAAPRGVVVSGKYAFVAGGSRNC